MKNINNIQIYNNFLLERIEKEILPCYNLWSLRSYQNQKHEFISGTCDETEKFSQFISSYAENESPMELLLMVGNGEKKYPSIMLNTSKKYMIIKFIENSSYLGEPLFLQNY
jgi:hypothetical protein